MEMQVYNLLVHKTITSTATVGVPATDLNDAKLKALDLTKHLTFEQRPEPEYTFEFLGAVEIKPKEQ